VHLGFLLSDVWEIFWDLAGEQNLCMFPLGSVTDITLFGSPLPLPKEKTPFGVILGCFSGEYVGTVDRNTEIVRFCTE